MHIRTQSAWTVLGVSSQYYYVADPGKINLLDAIPIIFLKLK